MRRWWLACWLIFSEVYHDIPGKADRRNRYYDGMETMKNDLIFNRCDLQFHITTSETWHPSLTDDVSGGSRGGRIGRRRPPPPFFGRLLLLLYYYYLFIFLLFCIIFFFWPFHPGGQSGRQTIPLPHNVNDDSATFSGLARHRGVWIPGPLFSQILGSATGCCILLRALTKELPCINSSATCLISQSKVFEVLCFEVWGLGVCVFKVCVFETPVKQHPKRSKNVVLHECTWSLACSSFPFNVKILPIWYL